MIKNIFLILISIICLDAMAYGPWIYGNGGISVQTPATQKAAIGTQTTSPLTAMLTVAAQSGVTAPITGTNLHISGADSTFNYVTLDAYGNENLLFFRRSAGTQASPTAIQSAEVIGGISGRAYGATGYSSGSRVSMVYRATENWTDSVQGTDIRFNTTINGSASAAERFRIDSAGSVSIGGAANANASAILDVTSTTKGFLPPRMTTTQRDAITPVAGLVIYNTTTNKHQGYNGTIWNDFY